ncbi:MAG: hypothetical protein V2B19_06770 [Pseudomonadota bacterium]
MKTVSLSIPYLVLSTQQHMDGRRQVHTRTPFGYIDISSILIDGRQHMPLFDVTVEGDLDPWIIDHQMPSAFRNTLFKFISKITLLHIRWPVRRHCRLVIRFKGTSSDFTVAGYLNMTEFLWQTEPDDLGEKLGRLST